MNPKFSIYAKSNVDGWQKTCFGANDRSTAEIIMERMKNNPSLFIGGIIPELEIREN